MVICLNRLAFVVAIHMFVMKKKPRQKKNRLCYGDGIDRQWVVVVQTSIRFFCECKIEICFKSIKSCAAAALLSFAKGISCEGLRNIFATQIVVSMDPLPRRSFIHNAYHMCMISDASVFWYAVFVLNSIST